MEIYNYYNLPSVTRYYYIQPIDGKCEKTILIHEKCPRHCSNRYYIRMVNITS